MRFWRHSRMRRMVTGLLALTLLFLPGVPLRHVAAAPGVAPAAHHCVTDEAEPAEHAGHAAPAPASDAAPDEEQPAGDTGGMACCAAAQCPATVAVPPSTLAAPLPLAAPAVTGFAADHQLAGIPVGPALRPPRRVA